MYSPPRPLTIEERDALQAFANANGKRWKDKLADVYWYNARQWRGPNGTDDLIGGVLHSIRNSHGPRWLHDDCTIRPE